MDPVVMRARIAVIPARGGSKRVPRKNIVPFFGKPMIVWTIEAALASDRFDRVLVSTDDEDIAGVARSHGAEVPFLRQTAVDDRSHVSTATLAAVGQAMAYWDEDYDTIVQLMPNCPLRGAEHILDALNVFEVRQAQFQISCFRYGWMNPWWAARLEDDGRPAMVFPDAAAARSQDLPPLYCPTGAIWVAKAKSLRVAETFYGPGHVFHPIPWTAAVDIDDAEDLRMARAVQMMLAADA
jgi:N-acylneuraminate cytidylyltransferase